MSLERRVRGAFAWTMFVAVIKEAAEAASAANGPFYGYPPWLVALIGTLAAALILWVFAKLMKWALWILIIVVLVVGIITAAKMYLGR